MKNRLNLQRMHEAILRSPRRVLIASGTIVLLAAVLGTQVELRTSRAELAPVGDPDQARWDALLRDYPASDQLVALIERTESGATADSARALADRLAEVWNAAPQVAQVFHRIDVQWIEDNLPHLIPAERLDTLLSNFEQHRERVDLFDGARNLSDVDSVLAGLLGAMTDSGASVSEPISAATLRLPQDYLRFRLRMLLDPDRVAAEIAAFRWLALAGSALPSEDGYLASRDGEFLILLIAPAGQDDSLATRRSLLSAVRSSADRILGDFPGLRVGFTGQPAIVVEEMAAVRTDTLRTSALAVVGVGLLTTLVFRWRSHAVWVLLALGCGIVVAFGAIELELGYLNLITSSFVSTLIGVGVAYGIHPISEYELEGAHTLDPHRALTRALQRTAPAVIVAGITTSAAFFSILLMRFRGFAELGLVAGFGVLFCLVAAMVTLPALVLLHGRRRHRLDTAPRQGSAVDSVWVDGFSRCVCRAPRTVVTIALGLTVASGIAAMGIGFDTNLMSLLPRRAESLQLQERMSRKSDLTPLFNLVVADNLNDLAALERSARSESSIASFQSILQFVSASPNQAEERLHALHTELERIRPGAYEAATAAERVGGFEALAERFGDAADQAFGAGLGDIAAALEAARELAEAAGSRAASASPKALARYTEVERQLWGRIQSERAWLLGALQTPPPGPASLPESLRNRFMTRSGRFLGFLYAGANLFEADRLSEFVAASRRVSPEVTGFPQVFYRMSGRIVGGLERAVLVGGVLVFAILWIDFRSLRDAVLAAVPLIMGALWMMGGMRVLGLQFNFANLVGVPLIIGIGIDNGVHVMHRVRLEGVAGIETVLRHTGRAILIASLTTMIGFGSLGLASHRGLASLGLVLLIGVVACLVTSTVVLPNLLLVLGRVNREM